MATVWVYWDGIPKVFSSAHAANSYRNECGCEGDVYEAIVDSDRLSILQDWELESGKTYRAIGRFMGEFSQLEYTLRHAVGGELGIKEEYFSETVTTFDVGVLCNLALAIFAKRVGRSEETKALINRFRDLNTHRQRVAHGLWVPFLEGGSVHYTARTSLKGASYKQQADALDRLADEACNLRNALSEELMGVGIFDQDYDC